MDDKIVIPLPEEDGGERNITFSIRKYFDFYLGAMIDAVTQERCDYLMHWLNEKTIAVDKEGCEWKLWIPHDSMTFAEIFSDIPEELDDVFHAAFIHSQELHTEKGESMVLILYTAF